MNLHWIIDNKNNDTVKVLIELNGGMVDTPKGIAHFAEHLIGLQIPRLLVDISYESAYTRYNTTHYETLTIFTPETKEVPFENFKKIFEEFKNPSYTQEIFDREREVICSELSDMRSIWSVWDEAFFDVFFKTTTPNEIKLKEELLTITPEEMKEFIKEKYSDILNMDITIISSKEWRDEYESKVKEYLDTEESAPYIERYVAEDINRLMGTYIINKPENVIEEKAGEKMYGLIYTAGDPEDFHRTNFCKSILEKILNDWSVENTLYNKCIRDNEIYRGMVSSYSHDMNIYTNADGLLTIFVNDTDVHKLEKASTDIKLFMEDILNNVTEELFDKVNRDIYLNSIHHASNGITGHTSQFTRNYISCCEDITEYFKERYDTTFEQFKEYLSTVKFVTEIKIQ